MSAILPTIELTLVLAATRDMGIGLNGGLPWTGLKKEMAYFARVTKRLPDKQLTGTKALNAVIMGRKTWDSIPPKFRPLKGRLNIVISRSVTSIPSASEKFESDEGPVMASSLEQAINYLRQQQQREHKVGKVFVIGGGQIYGAALVLPKEVSKRILLTRVLSPEFECDTFFPLELKDEAAGSEWERKSKEELNEFVGEEVPEGVQVENGTEYEYQMWERR
ncbi:dihydrofolate reductase-like domain-containing protein [Pseudoneurospora amorphoporcata]|uniref:Dihydrofolate reductase n=1 Tax=Pseudoneurospora amorphoporcata TaxID=241081 RepID=A0AAN6NV31_9PEZI|nr:dihydrofolate reductase-like domain-containing protein [Pseudoneurospora amorphoporcata]